jgi:hypothetical protein
VSSFIGRDTTNNEYYYLFNFKQVMGDLYDKYDFFNIHLESIVYNTTGQVTAGVEYSQVYHIDGFNWVNNYLDYGSSFNGRVLELANKANTYDNNKGLQYPSNCNTLLFRKPLDPLVRLIFYVSRVNGNDKYTIPANRPQMLLSITGVKMNHGKVPKPIHIPRHFNSSMFSLTGSVPYSLDPNNSAWRFPSFNLRNAIGSSLFDNYNKFGIITRRVDFGTRVGLLNNVGVEQTGEPTTGTAARKYSFSMSGLNWTRSSYVPYSGYWVDNINYTAPTSTYHTQQATIIALCNWFPSVYQTEGTYVFNTFRKTDSIIDLTIITHQLLNFDTPPTTDNTAYHIAPIFYFEVFPIIS